MVFQTYFCKDSHENNVFITTDQIHSKKNKAKMLQNILLKRFVFNKCLS